MSFHGGLIGVLVALAWYARKHGLPFLEVGDAIAAVTPVGLLFGRLANFINSELWGRPSDVPWAVVFPNGGPVARHPSQLYESLLEGALLLAVLQVVAWRPRRPADRGCSAASSWSAMRCPGSSSSSSASPTPISAISGVAG